MKVDEDISDQGSIPCASTRTVRTLAQEWRVVRKRSGSAVLTVLVGATGFDGIL